MVKIGPPSHEIKISKLYLRNLVFLNQGIAFIASLASASQHQLLLIGHDTGFYSPGYYNIKSVCLMLVTNMPDNDNKYWVWHAEY